MNSFLKRLGCSVLIAALIVGTMVWGINGLFDKGGSLQNQVLFPTQAPAQPDTLTEVMDLPDNLLNGTHTAPELDYDGNSNSMSEFGGDGITATKPGASESDDTSNDSTDNNNGSTNNGNGNDNNGDNNNDSTDNNNNDNNGNSSNNSKPNNGQTVIPPVNTNTNLGSVIKGHNYSSGLDIFQSSRNDIPTDTSALMSAIKKGYNKCSFIAIRISDGATIAYNANGLYNCASSYKAFASLYAFKQAEAGVYNLDTKLTYTSADYYPGSGIIKTSAIGSVYTLRQVADYSIRYSDNTAYTMLQRYINKAGLAEYGKKLGCPNASNYAVTNWPVVSPVDAALWWAEIYNFSRSSSYGSQLYNVFLNATNPIIKKSLNDSYAVAHKSGSTSYYFHDAGVVHSDDPYIIAIYTHNPTNYTSDNQSYVTPIVREIDKLINP